MLILWTGCAVIWIAIEFWPARVAGRKGHSFIGYFACQRVAASRLRADRGVTTSPQGRGGRVSPPDAAIRREDPVCPGRDFPLGESGR